MKNLILAFALTCFGFAVMGSEAMANHIGPAGCGLGNMVMKKKNQIFASTTNETFYNQIFGITSGTSGCVDSDNVAIVMFVDSNRIALANESARGKGETVNALAEMMNCSDSSQVGEILKSNYREIFEGNGENSIAITKSIRSTLAPTCGRVG